MIFTKSQKKILPIVFITIIIVIFAGFFVTVNIINTHIKDRCTMAMNKYKLDCVDSLILWLDDNSNDYRSRNSAIWALGQIGDARALPTLQKYYTGIIPEKESFDRGLSQYELKKAISYFQGSLNLTRFFR